MAVTIEMTGDEVKLLQSFQRVIDKQRKMIEQLRKTQQEAKNTKRSFREAFGEQVQRNIRNMALGLGGLGAVRFGAQLFGAELAQQRDVAAKAALAQTTLASARKDIIRNMMGAPAADISAALLATREIAVSQRIDEKAIAVAMAQALSASGGNLPLSRSAVGIAAQFLADKPAEIPMYAGSLLDIAKVTRSGDALTNLGYLGLVAARSRVVEPQLQAANIPPALIGQIAMGATPQGAAALYAALTTGAGDITGRRSGTAAIALAEQLRGFFGADEETRRTLRQQGKRQLAELPALGTQWERIAYLQQRPELAREFLKGASFEKKALGPIEQLLLDPTSAVARQYAQNLADLPTEAGLQDYARKLLEARGIDPLEIVAEFGRTLESGIEQIATGDLMAGMGGQARDKVLDILKGAGMSALGAKITGWGWDLGTWAAPEGALDRTLKLLRQRQRGLEEPVEWGITPGIVPRLTTEAREPTAEEARQADVLGLLVTELEALRKQMEESNRNTGALRERSERPELVGAGEVGNQ